MRNSKSGKNKKQLLLNAKKINNGQALIEILLSLVLFVILISSISTVCIYLNLQNAAIQAAHEGARIAALNTQLVTNNAAGINEVLNKTQQFFLQTTGQSLPSGNITVTGPTGIYGYRNVDVQVVHTFQNPIPIADFLHALGVSDTSGYDNLSVSAKATMRYEE